MTPPSSPFAAAPRLKARPGTTDEPGVPPALRTFRPGAQRQPHRRRAHPALRRPLVGLALSTLCLVALTVTWAVVIGGDLRREQGHGQAIDLVSRQRVLTQRIGSDAALLPATPPGPALDDLVSEIERNVRTVRLAQTNLLGARDGLPPVPAGVRRLLLGDDTSAEPSTAERMTTFLRGADSLALRATTGEADPVALAVTAALSSEAAAALLPALDEVAEAYSAAMAGAAAQAQRNMALLIGLTLAALALQLTLVYVPLVRRLSREMAGMEDLRAAQAETLTQLDFGHRVQVGLAMADNESAVLDVVGLALEEASPSGAAELFLADSSRAHLSSAAGARAGDLPGCSVETPSQCPAVAQGRTLRFESSRAIDACPWLRDREQVDRAACCVPLSFLGSSFGVLNARATDPTALEPRVVGALEVVAGHASQRIGILRTLSTSQFEASVDPLTGLLNRRSLADQLGRLHRSDRDYCLAMVDLDHFKTLNDSYGHEAGDRALRVFSQVVRSTVRVDDIVGRFGGEEFVIVLPGTTLAEAVALLERLRLELAAAVATGAGPAFTASMGLATRQDGSDPDSVIRAADAALLAAKQAGRDRVVLVDRDRPGPSEPGRAPSGGAPVVVRLNGAERHEAVTV